MIDFYYCFTILGVLNFLPFSGYFHKEKNILGCHQVFFLEVLRPFF